MSAPVKGLHTVLVVSSNPNTRAELSALLEAEGVFVAAELEPSDAFSTEGIGAVIWEADEPVSELPLGNELEVPLLALVRAPEEAARALRSGASGALWHTASPAHILVALDALAAGLGVLEPAFLSALPPPEDTWPLEPFTAREQEVLGLLAEGMSNKAIAKRLHISEHTVKFHLNAVLSKLGASNRTEAVTRALRAGVLTL